MQWATPIFAANSRYFQGMMNQDKTTWWNKNKVFKSQSELNEARALAALLEGKKSCEEDGTCWFQVGDLVAYRDIHTYKNSYILHKTSIKTLLKPLKPNKNH
jgi:hypothetical protein